MAFSIFRDETWLNSNTSHLFTDASGSIGLGLYLALDGVMVDGHHTG